MSRRDAGLNIVISGDAKGATKAFKGAGAAAKQLAGDTAEASSRVDQLGSFARKVAIGAGLKYAADQASDLAESVNVTGLIFGDAAGEIDEFVESSAKIGFSEAQARELTGSLGGLLANLGLAQDETVDWSKKLLELGADMGSAFNTDPADAVEAIGSALRGEQEPIRRYNVVLDDATVRAKAVEMGLASTAAQVTKTAKAQATLALITEQTSKIQGDFRNTSGDAANAQRVARAEFNNAAAALGKSLSPAVAEAAKAVGFLAGEFASMPGPVQQSVLAMAGIALAGPRVVEGLGAVRKTTRSVLDALGEVPGKGKGATTMLRDLAGVAASYPVPTAIAAAGVLGLGAALVQMASDADTAADAAKNVAEEAQRLGQTAQEVMGDQLANSLAGLDSEGLENFGKNAGYTRGALYDLQIGTTELTQALLTTDDAYDALIAKIEAKRDAPDASQNEHAAAVNMLELLPELRRQYELAASTDKLVSGTKEQVAKALNQEADANTDASTATDRHTSAVNRQTTALGRNRDSLSALTEAAAKRIETTTSLADATDATAAAIEELNELEATAAGQGEEVADARAQVAAALEGEADAARGVTDAQAKLRDSQAELNEAYATASDRLRDKALAAREAADAEAGAVTSAKRARKELERARAGGADALELEEKTQAVREADTAVATAREKARQQTRENEQAQLRGITGDEQVVAARKAVAEATRGVTDADRALADARTATSRAEERAAKVIAEAKAKIADATDKVVGAMLSEASAAGDAEAAQHGAGAGALAHADRLRDLTALLAPGSELRRNLEDYIALLEHAGLGRRVGLGEMSLAAAEHQIAAGPRSSNEPGPDRTSNVTINQTNILQGTPQQQRRAYRGESQRLLDEVARGAG